MLRGDGLTTISSHVLKQRGYSLAPSEVGQGTQVICKLPDLELVAKGKQLSAFYDMKRRLHDPKELARA